MKAPRCIEWEERDKFNPHEEESWLLRNKKLDSVLGD